MCLEAMHYIDVDTISSSVLIFFILSLQKQNEQEWNLNIIKLKRIVENWKWMNNFVIIRMDYFNILQPQIILNKEQ